MDFLEGFFLGPLWSDTEYETQRHIGFHLLLGALISGLYLFWLVFPDKLSFWHKLPPSLYLVFFLLTFLVTPFICRLYYQYILPVKLLLILVQVFKFLTIILFVIQKLLVKYNMDFTDLPQQIMEEVNLSIAKATDFFEQFGRATAMILGIVGGGLMIVLKVAVAVLVLLVIPILFLQAIKLLQWFWDYLVQKNIFRETRQ